MKKIFVSCLLLLFACFTCSCGMITNAFLKTFEAAENHSESAYSLNDAVSGKTWKAKDGSLLCLNEDGSFFWYQKPENRSDSYYSGSYEVYNGKAAIDYIVSELPQYSLTQAEQEEFIERNEDYTYENYYCLVLDNKECIINGENTLDTSQSNITPYYGFYFENEQYLDLANMNSGNYSSFTLWDQ